MKHHPPRLRALITGLIVAALLAASCGDTTSSGAEAPVVSGGADACAVSYENFAGAFLLNWCVGCHSSSLAVGERQLAPPGADFDTLAGVRLLSSDMRDRVYVQRNMPPLGGPSDEERQLFADWVDCGMPSTSGGFTPPPPSGLMDMTPPPTGTCAQPRMFVPQDVLPRCEAATLDCVVRCGIDNPEYDQEACRNGCLAADTTPADTSLGQPINCANCTLGQLLACADQGGCHDETAAFLCCLEECGGGEQCQTECSGQLQAFGLCVYYTAPECVDYVAGPIGQCFAAGSGALDAGADAATVP